MPDKWQALQQFWENFGLRAYDENTVPDSAEMPYITYEAKTAGIGTVLPLTASLWYDSGSWTEISEKAEKIAEYIGYGHRIIKLDNGYLYITKGSPFAQRMREPGNDKVRRIVINISCEFLTAY